MIRRITIRHGKEEGPISVVLAGVHGNEVCGIEAFERLLPSLHIASGTVFFVVGNPRAIKENVRYTEANLNRMFKNNGELSSAEKRSYEYRQAQFIKKYLVQADALLDVHASRTRRSRRFVISEPNAERMAKFLPFDLVVSGLDRVQAGGTDYYMNKKGKIGLCIECGYLGDPRSTDVAVKSILSFLAARGHIRGVLRSRKQEHVRMERMYVAAHDNFTLSKRFSDFERITRGQVIGTDGGKSIRAEKDGVILFAGSRKRAGEEAFLLGVRKKTA
jgi:succinylglutamate desuccinylase